MTLDPNDPETALFCALVFVISLGLIFWGGVELGWW